VHKIHHEVADRKTSQRINPAGSALKELAKLGDFCSIGANATILQRVTISVSSHHWSAAL